MSAIATSWIVHLVVGGVQAALLGLLALTLVRLSPRSSASWRHALLALAMLKFAVPPMIPLPFGAFTALTPAVRPPLGALESALRGNDLALTLASVQLIGMVLMLLRIAHGAHVWRNWVALSTRDERLSELLRDMASAAGWRGVIPEVRVARSLPVPMAGGLRRPVVLVSEAVALERDPTRVRFVLRHELEHLARRDPWWNLAGSLLQIVWWWHPVFALLLREARRIREERCDDAVVSASPESARDYAHTLIDLTPRGAAVSIPVPACGATGSLFEQRLRRLLATGVERGLSVGPRAIAALVLFALVTLPGFRLASLEIRGLTERATGVAFRHAHDHRHDHSSTPASGPPRHSPR